MSRNDWGRASGWEYDTTSWVEEEPSDSTEGGRPLPDGDALPPRETPPPDDPPPAWDPPERTPPPEPPAPAPEDWPTPPPEDDPGESTTPIGGTGGGDAEPVPGSATVRIDEWRTAQDARVCPICGPLDGQRFAEGEGPYPPAHLGCRCVRVMVGLERRTVQHDEGIIRRRW